MADKPDQTRLVAVLQRIVDAIDQDDRAIVRAVKDLLSTTITNIAVDIRETKAWPAGDDVGYCRRMVENIIGLATRAHRPQDTPSEVFDRYPWLLDQPTTFGSVLHSMQIQILVIGNPSIVITGPPDQVLAFQTMQLVRAVGERVRVCRCTKLFVRTGKREYCSLKCQRRFNMQNWRAQNGLGPKGGRHGQAKR